jgi:SAM-dependent methyltransferase
MTASLTAEQHLVPVANVYNTNARWLRVRTADYFGTLDFSGLHILDIGAGSGLYACCMASLNAAHLVALEPEFDGSRNAAIKTFQHAMEMLGLPNLEFHPIAMQAYSAPPASFDLIYMLAVINHLDETLVQMLHTDESSRAAYRQLLQPVFDWLKPGGMLVISDVPRTHPYMRLGLPHPFQPQIEWHKHQHPRLWKALLESIGFTSVKWHWATQWRYPQLPRFLFDNLISAQLYASQFVLRAQK